MQQNLHAPLSIARIARDLGVGRRKLERHFSADLGVPPADASIRIRLAQARLLLRQSSHTITRIAEETGFCDASHLIRVFREATGVTPDQWRQSEQGMTTEG
ncbi:helix-turn-helix domain-containing protein [Paracoccus cavernae]